MSIHLIGGGTHFHVRPHLALSAPAYGATARALAAELAKRGRTATVHLTRMAGGPPDLDTNDDVARLVRSLVADRETRILFVPAALTDFTGAILDEGIETASGKTAPRLRTCEGSRTMALEPAAKVIAEVRRERKDIFLVAFKTTSGASPDEQWRAGLELLKRTSSNLVLANDIVTKLAMVVTPEEGAHHVTHDRAEALAGLVEMALLRSALTFTRSTVVPGEVIPWSSELVPPSLRTVVDHCIARGAYKPFLGSTAGHFAVKLGEGRFLTSRRKVDFQKLSEVGLVMVETLGDHQVVAHGARPSVGGQSQRIVFTEHPGVDCIVHFHCPMRPGSRVPTRAQRPYECGSHECGKNTSDGLERMGDVLAVMLDRHGPNITFSREVDAEHVIRFIEENFDLEGSTAGVRPESCTEPQSGRVVEGRSSMFVA